MDIGRKNIQLGWIFILVAALIGLTLSIVLPIIDPDMITDQMKTILQLGYIQALVVAFLNIFVGMLLDRTDLSERLKALASIFILLALLQPTGTILGALWKTVLLVVIERIGTVCLLVAACIMASAFYLPEVRRD